MTDAVLFAVIGPNPASVSEAIWALYRQRDIAIVEAHVVTLLASQQYLELELLGDSGPLAELRTLLPGVLPTGEDAVVAHQAHTPEGRPLKHDLAEADGAAYEAAIWTAARECMARAGARPVIHLLAGGRMRTMTSYSTMVFQLLARPGDELFDVRVSERRAEGGSGFFFPEQRQRFVGELDATSVAVQLVPVRTTRLRAMLGAHQLTTFAEANLASQVQIDVAAPPLLRIDLRAGRALANDIDLELTRSQFVYYAALARTRMHATDADGGWLRAQIEDELPVLLPEFRTVLWREDVQDNALRWAFGIERKRPTGLIQKDNLTKLRADLKTGLGKRLDAVGRAAWKPQLIHTLRRRKGEAAHRLPLAPDRIEFA